MSEKSSISLSGLTTKLRAQFESVVSKPQGRYTLLEEDTGKNEPTNSMEQSGQSTGFQTHKKVKVLDPRPYLKEADSDGKSIWEWKKWGPIPKSSENPEIDGWIWQQDEVPLGTFYMDPHCQTNNENRGPNQPVIVKKTIRAPEDGQAKTFCYGTHKSKWTENDFTIMRGCVNHTKCCIED